MAIDKELYTLALPYSNTTFRATSVKLYLVLEIDNIAIELAGKELTSDELAGKPSKELVPLLVKRSKGRPRKNLNLIIFL